MSLQSVSQSWEQSLLALAQDNLCMGSSTRAQRHAIPQDKRLNWAVAACERITAAHSRSFSLASGLLPREKRQAMRVLYAFCRTADDIADSGVEQPEARLRALRIGITNHSTDIQDLVLSAWADIQTRYRIPVCYAEQLLDGVECDLTQKRYRTFTDLSVYCYGVASTVGLMSMHITGFSDERAIPYAIKLGVALQLTNILRDVGEDWNSGRLYLPLEELTAFGLEEDDIAAGVSGNAWRAFMRFQIARARRLYAEAMPGIDLLHADGRLAVAAAAMLYRGILEDIEAHDFDVFTRRAHVTSRRKLALLAAAFQYSKSKHL